jgi:hypothetical protein
MTTHGSGTFEVKFEKEETLDKDAAIAIMSIIKEFHGDLEATSRGEMIATMESNRSGAYAAIERVTGALNGRTGSFVLLHNGTMTTEGQQLSVDMTGLVSRVHLNTK